MVYLSTYIWLIFMVNVCGGIILMLYVGDIRQSKFVNLD